MWVGWEDPFSVAGMERQYDLDQANFGLTFFFLQISLQNKTNLIQASFSQSHMASLHCNTHQSSFLPKHLTNVHKTKKVVLNLV